MAKKVTLQDAKNNNLFPTTTIDQVKADTAGTALFEFDSSTNILTLKSGTLDAALSSTATAAVDMVNLTQTVKNAMSVNKIAGAATEAVILAKTSDTGIWVGTDTNKWYYWSGTAYVAGGDFVSTADQKVVIVQDSEPTGTDKTLNKIWINESGEDEIEVYTTDEADEKYSEITADINNKCVKGLYVESGSDYKNFNDAPTNKIITYVPNESEYSNYPTLTKGNLITFNGYTTESKAGTSQLYIDNYGIVYSRTTWDGTIWSNWVSISNNSLFAPFTLSGSNYKNFNDAPNNKILTYVPNSTDYYNYPTLVKGNLITFNGYSAIEKNGTSQFYIDNSGTIYSRTTWDGSSWSEWKKPAYDALVPSFSAGGDNYKNFNDAPNNTIITYAPNATEYSNYPILKYGNLVTLNGFSPTLKNGTTQIYIDKDGFIYSRTTWDGSSWSNWLTHSYSLMPSFDKGGDNYKNFNDAPINKIITYVPNSTEYSNYPTTTKGNLISFSGYSATSKAGTSQFYIDNSGKIYTRTTWDGTNWSKWNKTASERIKYDDFVKKYDFSGKTAVFFGDSITAGYIGNSKYIDDPYPVLFSNYVGMTGYNEAVVNASFAPSTITNLISAQIEGSTHKSADFVFIACGVNDWNAGNTLSDVETYVNNNIDYILENYPNADIIFITPINNNRNVEGNLAPLSEYSNTITRCAILKDISQRISVVQGYKFLFPTVEDDESFRNTMFADIVHPSEFGHKTAYLNGLIKALVR